PEQHLQRGRLARAVGAQEPEDLSARDLERQVFHRPHPPPPEADAERLGEPLGADDDLHREGTLAWRSTHLQRKVACAGSCRPSSVSLRWPPSSPRCSHRVCSCTTGTRDGCTTR